MQQSRRVTLKETIITQEQIAAEPFFHTYCEDLCCTQGDEGERAMRECRREEPLRDLCRGVLLGLMFTWLVFYRVMKNYWLADE